MRECASGRRISSVRHRSRAACLLRIGRCGVSARNNVGWGRVDRLDPVVALQWRRADGHGRAVRRPYALCPRPASRLPGRGCPGRRRRGDTQFPVASTMDLARSCDRQLGCRSLRAVRRGERRDVAGRQCGADVVSGGARRHAGPARQRNSHRRLRAAELHAGRSCRVRCWRPRLPTIGPAGSDEHPGGFSCWLRSTSASRAAARVRPRARAGT